MKKNILKQAELDHLAQVITELEKKTDGEIRLMIVGRSSATGHVHFTVWMSLLSLSFFVLWFLRHEMIFFEGWWLWPALIVSTYLAALGLARCEGVQRGFTSLNDLKHDVWTRAEVEFHREGLGRTQDHTGVLIFLSLMERQAVVLADRGISSKVAPTVWDDVVKLVLTGARKGQWAKQLEAALLTCGRFLAEHFPPVVGKGNELPNAVIVKD